MRGSASRRERTGQYLDLYSWGTMPEGSPSWTALTTLDVIAMLVGAVVLILERAFIGYVTFAAGVVAFVAMWILRREATKQALRAIVWGIIWSVTGWGGPWNDR
jgi:hypothetical protein